MARIKYLAVSKNGAEFTRTSERTYTHAAIFTYKNGGQCASFSGSADLAQKVAPAYGTPESREVVPVTIVVKAKKK